jgi:hypothetical protein
MREVIREFNRVTDQDQLVALWKRVFGYQTEPRVSMGNKIPENSTMPKNPGDSDLPSS